MRQAGARAPTGSATCRGGPRRPAARRLPPPDRCRRSADRPLGRTGRDRDRRGRARARAARRLPARGPLGPLQPGAGRTPQRAAAACAGPGLRGGSHGAGGRHGVRRAPWAPRQRAPALAGRPGQAARAGTPARARGRRQRQREHRFARPSCRGARGRRRPARRHQRRPAVPPQRARLARLVAPTPPRPGHHRAGRARVGAPRRVRERRPDPTRRGDADRRGRRGRRARRPPAARRRSRGPGPERPRCSPQPRTAFGSRWRPASTR